jgi:uncharacterized protein YeaC (DUF1315 family)
MIDDNENSQMSKRGAGFRRQISFPISNWSQVNKLSQQQQQLCLVPFALCHHRIITNHRALTYPTSYSMYSAAKFNIKKQHSITRDLDFEVKAKH